jgi:hypothetical protein
MPEASEPVGRWVFAYRDARRRSDQEAAEQLQRRKEEELATFRQRLENFQLTSNPAWTASGARSRVARAS